MRILKQNTAANVMVLMTAASDHVTGLAGLTLTITLSKDGAAFASISPTVTDRGNGWYNIALTTSHTDTLGDCVLHITGAAADPTDVISQVHGKTLGDIPSLADIATSVWDALLTGITTVGSIGKLIKDNLDAAISTRASQTSVDIIDDFLDTEIAAIKAKTDNLPSDPADASDIATAFGSVNSSLSTIAGYIDTEVGAIKNVTDKLDTAIEVDGPVYRFTTNALEMAPVATPPTAADIADAVWDEALAGHLTAGSAGEKLNDAALEASVSSMQGDINTIDGKVDLIDAAVDLLPLLNEIEASAVLAKEAKLDELHQLHGLKLGSPMTSTPATRSVGGIIIALTGDGINTSTATRQP